MTCFTVKQKLSNIVSNNYIITKKNHPINTIQTESEYNNISYHPISSKGWLDSVYTYNPSNCVQLINNFKSLYNLFASYFNALNYTINSFYIRGKINFYSLLMLILIITPYLLEINIFYHVKVLLLLIVLTIFIQYISSNNFRYNIEELGIIFGYTDQLIRTIVDQSVIPTYLTCMLLYIGLCLLFYTLTLDKYPLSILALIDQFLKHIKIYLLILFGFFILMNFLAYFDILIINKSNLILFTLTIFTRIVFFKFVLFFGFYLYKKEINVNLLSLNIVTVLLTVGIVYLNVFIFFPLISSTINIGYNGLYSSVDNMYKNIYITMDNLYNSIYTSVNNFCLKIENNIISYKNDLNIYIQSCEKYISSFYNFCEQLSNGIIKISHLFQYISSLFISITGIEFKESIHNFLQVNKFLFSMLHSNISNLTWKTFYGENVNYFISKLIDRFNRDTMVVGQEQESSVESSSKDLSKPKQLVMRMDNNGESSSSGTRRSKRNVNHILPVNDQDQDLHETKREKKNRFKREYRAKQASINKQDSEKFYEMEWKSKHTTPVILKDLEGNIKGFYSSQVAVAKDLGVNKSAICNSMRNGTTVQCNVQEANINTKFNEKYRIEKIHRYHPDITKDIADQINDNNFRKGNRIYICDERGCMQEFPSIQQAANFFKLTEDTFRKEFKTSPIVNFKLGNETYVVWKEKPLESLKGIMESPKVKHSKGIGIPVSIIDSKGNTWDFSTIRAAFRFLGVEPKKAHGISHKYIEKKWYKKGEECYWISKR